MGRVYWLENVSAVSWGHFKSLYLTAVLCSWLFARCSDAYGKYDGAQLHTRSLAVIFREPL